MGEVDRGTLIPAVRDIDYTGTGPSRAAEVAEDSWIRIVRIEVAVLHKEAGAVTEAAIDANIRGMGIEREKRRARVIASADIGSWNVLQKGRRHGADAIRLYPVARKLLPS